jgi:CRP-like cAMP-binding protein
MHHFDRATDADWAEVLAGFPLFAHVRKRQLRKLVHDAKFVELARGESLSSSGAEHDSLYVILGGEASMLLPVRLTLRTGDYFGELGVLGARPYSLYVVANDHLHLMKLPHRPVLELARRQQPVTMTLLRDLSLRLRPRTAS